VTSVRAFVAAPAARRAAREALAEPDARWSLLMVCVVVYILAAVGRVHQLVPALGVTRPTMVSAALALVCIALDNGAIARLRFTLRLPAVRWLTAMVAWAGLGIPLALWPGGAFDIVFNGLLKALAMLIAVITAIRGRRDIKRLVAALFAATSIFATFVFIQVDVEPLTARFARLVYYDSNEFALLAVATMPLGAYALWRARHAALRVVITSLFVIVFIVFVGCGSRGGVLALAAALIFALLRFSVLKLRWRVLGLAVIAAAFVFAAADQFWKRVDSVVAAEDDYNFTSPTGRIQVWTRGIGYMTSRPILGVGAGNFSTAEGVLSEYARRAQQSGRGNKWSVAHNSYVQVGAELGVPGLVFFSAAILSAMLGLNRVATLSEHAGRPDSDLRALAQACLTGLIGFAVGATFLSLAYSDLLLALLAVALSIYAHAVRTKAILSRLNPRYS
jgi:O-antigen ligase